MEMGEKIKALRIEKNMTLEDLGKRVGVGKSTVRKWENGMIANMRRDKIARIAAALDVSPGYLMGWESEEYGGHIETTVRPTLSEREWKIICDIRRLDGYTQDVLLKHIDELVTLTDDERELIRKYHDLDDSGKLFIKNIMDHESERIAEKIDKISTNSRIYAYYNKIAAAGSGFYFDDIPAATIEAPHYPGADFIIGVNGDSMEPDYFDGDNVYVRRSQDIPIGSVGIFTIGNECFIKERGADGLISRNPKYDIINGTEDVRAVGEVLGKVEKKEYHS